MKKIIAWILLVVMLLGMFAGCKKKAEDPTEPPTAATTEPAVEDAAADINDAIAYLQHIYKDDGAKTPVDYERFGIVRIAGIPFEVVWTADVSEDLIKIIVNDDGTVTIDVNEECEEDTPYVLTATITDKDGNSVSYSWNYILPMAVDMVSIVEAAYALAPGESLPYESTLTGKIISIGSPWSDEYKNITVTIEVEGAEDKPIECYRLKGEGAQDLKIGDIITVTGTLKNYNGTIEFDSGCILESVIPGERVEAPDDPKQIVKEAYALGANKSLPYEATLTGTITQVGTPYSSQYGNVTVTMVVEGMENYPIVCYRLKGAGADQIGVNDLITVKGYITNYVGSAGYSTIEFTAGCQLLSWEDRAAPVAPSDPAQIVKDAYALAPGKSLPYQASLTGVITKVNTPYSSQYGNVTVTMVVGNLTNMPIKCYRLAGAGADQIGVGDTITVYGYIKNYQHTSGDTEVEFDQGCILVSWQDTGADVVEPEEPVEGFWKNEVVTNPAAGTAYKLGLTQKGIAGEPVLYFNGSTTDQSWYLDTTKDPNKAVDVYLEETAGGYLLYFMDGQTKTYIRMNERTDKEGSGTMELTTTKPAEFYTFDTTYNTLVHTNSSTGNSFFMGTYSTFTSMSSSNTSYLAAGNYPAQLLLVSEIVDATVEDAAVQLKKEYPNGAAEDGTLPTTITVNEDAFDVAWKLETENAEAVKIENGKVVTVQQAEAVPYKLIATITKGEESTEVVWEYTLAALPVAIADGSYVLWVANDNVVATALAETAGYGYLPATNVTLDGDKLTGYLGENCFTIENNGDDTFKLMDAYGRYLYMKGTYNSYNVDTTAPETGADWIVEKVSDGVYYIKNVLTGKYMAYESNYGSFGAYTDKKSEITITAAGEITVTAQMVADALKADYPNGYDADNKLIESYEFDNATYHVEWTLETENAAAVYIENGALVFVPQQEDVAYKLTATVQHESEYASVVYEGVVNKISSEPEPEPDPDGMVLTIAEAIAKGTAMGHDTYTETKYKVTGVIKEVYNTQYGNMRITDEDGNILTLYGTFDADGTNRYDAMEVKPVAGDTITVYGAVGQYNGTAQIKNGWIVEHIPGEVTPDPDPEPDPEPDPDGTVLTIAEAIAKGTAMGHDTYTETKYKVTGVIKEVYNTQYGNMKLADENGNILTLYGTYDADGTNRYDAMEVKPVAGDTITVYGAVGQYNGTAQIKNGWIVEHVPAEPVPTVPAAADAAAALKASITELADGMELSSTYTFEETEFAVAWNVLTDNAAAASIVDGKLVLAAQSVDVAYTLTAVVSLDDDSANVSWTGTVAKAEELPDVDGTVLTIAEAIAKGTAMGHDTYTEVKYKVTGVIKEVYNTQYGNMRLVDEEGNILTLYGTYSADGANRYDAMEVKPVAGDTITVYGAVGQYNGTAQIKNGWIVEHIPGEVDPDPDPEPDPEPDPDGTVLTIAEAIAKGTAMGHDTYTETKYKVTGVIKEVYNTQYGNMKLADENGNILTLYGTYSADGANRYDAMEVKPVAGDTITIYGAVGQYNGTAQIKNGWIVEHTPAEVTPDPDPEPGEGEEVTMPEAVAPVAGTAYNFGMIQENVSTTDIYYLAGGMSGYYMATTTDAAAAIPVYVEETTGGYYLYTTDGTTKLYINMVVSGTHVNGAYEETASTVYTYDEESKTLIADVDGTDYWFATRNDNTYTTLGPAKTSFNGFYAKFYAVEGGEGEGEGDGEEAVEATETMNIFANTGVLADDKNSISWTSNGVTFLNEKNTSTSPIRTSDADHFRVYKYNKTTVSVEDAKITKIVITATNETQVGYLTGTTMTEGAIVTTDGLEVTITFASGSVDAFVIEATNNQWRLNKIVVTYVK